ncbi:DUF3750 domain-containing protein [Methylobacterium mesophilicum SR1.6/6]|uniref:DUF3750 domain-containing protein n=1 Tax=Methylobacterium mesophilicum SR1.6/6 TaxID=908290 RepID=A0A6B9FPX9_9HYPH|nr:DUF3750 domain-containing protein [Methylobacterium mesophilicum]QGY03005.1 DUF3750 domain-containing protein [Methylobacterium mesophilicum SR1.6/6]
MTFVRIALLALAALFLVPIAISATLYWLRASGDWRLADRSSAGLLPQARANPEAVVRILSARTVSWRGIVATHSWIVIKDRDAPAYQRFDYTAWGQPIWIDRFVPDGRWFGNAPAVIFAADGPGAEAMLPRIRKAVAEYRYAQPGDYVVWPGPNSNTFVAAIMAAVPEIRASLPTTAIGKDFPYDGRWFGSTPSGTGIRINLGGYAGLTVGWVEGLELNLLGGVAGIDLRRPGIKLPALGRFGM